MTFGIAFTSPSLAGIVTDRRISSATQVVTDEYAKSGIVDFRNGRLAYTYTGLTFDLEKDKAKRFNAARDIAISLCASGDPDGDMVASMSRLKVLLTKRFETVRSSAVDKRTSIVLVGYGSNALGLQASEIFFLSNFEKYDGSEVADEARASFSLEHERLPYMLGVVRMVGSGASIKVNEKQRRLLVALLSGGVQPTEIVKAAVRVIRSAAAAEQSVGDQCSSLLVGPRVGSPVSSGYHVLGVSDSYYVPSYVSAYWDHRGAHSVVESEYSGIGSDGNVITSVADNTPTAAPCPCHSGRRYRDCHGSKKPPAKNAPAVTSGLLFEVAKFPEGEHEIEIASFYGRAAGRIDGMRVGTIYAG